MTSCNLVLTKKFPVEIPGNNQARDLLVTSQCVFVQIKQYNNESVVFCWTESGELFPVLSSSLNIYYIHVSRDFPSAVF